MKTFMQAASEIPKKFREALRESVVSPTGRTLKLPEPHELPRDHRDMIVVSVDPGCGQDESALAIMRMAQQNPTVRFLTYDSPPLFTDPATNGIIQNAIDPDLLKRIKALDTIESRVATLTKMSANDISSGFAKRITFTPQFAKAMDKVCRVWNQKERPRYRRGKLPTYRYEHGERGISKPSYNLEMRFQDNQARRTRWQNG